MHKADRGEEAVNSRWLLYFQKQGLPAMLSSVQTPRLLNSFLGYLKTQERRRSGSRIKRSLRLVIVGIPNVGKSTLINSLVRRAVTRTGDQPGVTRGRQWVRLLPGVELLDTPGVLPPVLLPETVFPLAAIGALPPGRIDRQQTALWLLDHYLERDEEARLMQCYDGLHKAAPAAMLEQIGMLRGCLLPEGKIDLERAAVLLLRDYQAGALGRFSLEAVSYTHLDVYKRQVLTRGSGRRWWMMKFPSAIISSPGASRRRWWWWMQWCGCCRAFWVKSCLLYTSRCV